MNEITDTGIINKNGIENGQTEQQHGLLSLSGQPIFDSPSPEWVQRVSKIPRVEYFSYRFSGKVLDQMTIDGETIVKRGPPKLPQYPIDIVALSDDELSTIRSEFHVSPGEWFFTQMVTDFLDDQIARDFPDHPIGLRGTACALNGHITHNGMHIRSIEEILRNGTEREATTTAATSFDPEHPDIPNRSLQWLIQHPQEIRALLQDAPDLAKTVFPVLLVYDAQDWVKTQSSTLPISDQFRSQAILKAYILDYPNK